MTNDEITQRYLTAIHGRQPKGPDGMLHLVLSHLIMDLWYQTFNRKIGKLDLKYECAYRRNRWIEAYNVFNGKFFAAYTPEEYTEVTDRMDAMESAIHNDIVRLRMALRDCCKHLPELDQDVVSDWQLCRVYCDMAREVWQIVYGFDNGRLAKIQTLGMRWLESWGYRAAGNEEVRLNMTTEASLTTYKILCQKVVNWAYEYK